MSQSTQLAAGQISQLNISDGGVPKLSVPEVAIEINGLVGDRQKNLKHHGGPDRAVCLWSSEVLQMLQAEGHPITAGSAGENMTISGLDWSQLSPGMHLRLGDIVMLQITDYAQPCRTIQRNFKFRRYGRISQKRYPGDSRLYARVLVPGQVCVGDPVAVYGVESQSHSD
ncbi:MOSC domain-containing protein [filamentous cyanobacterium LEGE 11480]|uniref:MOSC domain-containing protein n=1 Tax=Romeriopsis navalis LEGE 11480 TaxID=2777977 RepID=A0A928VV54_9CYAN|nr:MOSC domain-containing protein [Romeriopsis navalis]MBE9033160.1 MOSC domain-containing protein [Romeriopsis navalis LEGE 11480]